MRQRVKVKICGITLLEDALACLEAGSDALGFVFYRKSPRYIPADKAAALISRLPRQVHKVGVFVDAREKDVRRIARECRLDMLQFHGRESAGFCRRFRRFTVIKAFRVGENLSAKDLSGYGSFAWLFDTFVKDAPGGTGRSFDWNLLKRLPRPKAALFLSGGLSSANVGRAIRAVRPQWVDVSTSVESAPGRKDHRKVRAFIRAARQASVASVASEASEASEK